MTWALHAATRTGPHHLKRSEPNQDAYALRIEGDVVILAAADGAGSLPLSHQGSALAVSTATELAAQLVASGRGRDHADLEDVAAAAVFAAADALQNHEDHCEIGSTLVVVLGSPRGWAACAVGDSFAVLDFGGGRYELIRPPAAGEYANITKLLTSATLDAVVFGGPELLNGAAVSSDGLDWATLSAGRPHPAFYRPLFTKAAEGTLDLPGLLEHMDAAGKLDDDTTLAIAVRVADGAGRGRDQA